MVDKSLLDKFQNSFFRNTNLSTINLLNGANSNLLINKHLNNDFGSLSSNVSNNVVSNVSTNLSDIITDTITSAMSTTLSTISNTIADTSVSTSTIRPLDHSSTFADISNHAFTNNSTLISDTATSISSIATSSFDLLDRNELTQRTFSNLTNSLVLEFYNIKDEVFWKNIIFLTVIFLCLRVLAYVILVLKTNRFK